MITLNMEYLYENTRVLIYIYIIQIYNLSSQLIKYPTGLGTRERMTWCNRPVTDSVARGRCIHISDVCVCWGGSTIKLSGIILWGLRDGFSILKYHIIILKNIFFIYVSVASPGDVPGQRFSRFANGRYV